MLKPCKASFAAFIVGLSAVLASAGHAAEPADSAATSALPEGGRTLLNIAYVANGSERQMLDLYLPSTATNCPLIVWIHGGGWTGGSKEKPPGLRFLRHGFALASINYRLSQDATFPAQLIINYRLSQDATFPAQLIDCKAAIRWLRAHATQNGIDPNRIGVWGASAGGHLVALLGTTGDLKEFDTGENTTVSSRVQCVCDWFGPTDFTSNLKHDDLDQVEARLIGGPISQNFQQAQRASPIHYITKGDPPFLIVHGDKDPVVPLQQSQLLADALKKAGVEVAFHVVPGGGHGGPEFVTPDELERLFVFFAKTLKAG
jgi:acetyl esterase/lipase